MVIISAFTRKILTGVLGDDRAKSFSWSGQNVLMLRLLKERPADWLPAGYTDYVKLLRDCSREARASLTRQAGADPVKWTWGAYRQASFPHPLANIPIIGGAYKIAPFPMNGGSSTVNVGSYVSMRFIADPGNWDFLTGALIDITAISEQFGLQFWRSNPNEPINHNVRTVVVDATGRIQWITPENEWKSDTLVEQMVRAARAKPGN